MRLSHRTLTLTAITGTALALGAGVASANVPAACCPPNTSTSTTSTSTSTDDSRTLNLAHDLLDNLNISNVQAGLVNVKDVLNTPNIRVL